MTNKELYDFFHTNQHVISSYIISQINNDNIYVFSKIISCPNKCLLGIEYSIAFEFNVHHGYNVTFYLNENFYIYVNINFVNKENIIKFVKRLYTTQQILK